MPNPINLMQHPNGPIPGENYTSDTKNYPWHRPPDHTDLDSAIVDAMKHLSQKANAYGLLNSLSLGVTVVQAATMFVISGVGKGKWTVDHAILLAGPVAKIIQIMADGAKIKYDMGLEDDPIPTVGYYGELTKIESENVSFAGEAARDKIKTVRPPNPAILDQVKQETAQSAPPTEAPPSAGFMKPMGGM